MNDRLRRARASLRGLSVGDALGEQLTDAAARVLPPAPWRWTDDTEMALAIVEVLREHGHIDQPQLAARLARRYQLNPRRGYGGTAHEILRAIGDIIAFCPPLIIEPEQIAEMFRRFGRALDKTYAWVKR